MTSFPPMRTVFYDCQTSSNIVVPDRATGTMWGAEAFRQWSNALMTAAHISAYFRYWHIQK